MTWIRQIYRNWLKKISGVIALAVLSILWLAISIVQTPNSVLAGFFDDDLEIFEEVFTLISESYIYPPDYLKLYSSAIEEMASFPGLEALSFEQSNEGTTVSKGEKTVQYNLSPSSNHNFRELKKVYYFLLNNFQETLTDKQLETAGIVGAMNSLDPYSQYLDKNLFERSMRDTEGKYGGLGMIITMRDNRLTILKTMKNSPARKVGILPFDIITSVDGKKTIGLQIEELANLLRGYQDTKVHIKVFRPEDNLEKEYVLTRKIISVETVEYKKIGKDTGYIKITSFSKQTNDQLEEALKEGLNDRIRALILDLRNNPGGLLDQSIKVASHFVDRGKLIVYTQGREKADRKDYQSVYRTNLKEIPTIILMNQRSASASEIVAGALRDSGSALIVGEKSYGKGLVQTIFRIRDKSGIRLTTSKYYTPAGTDINQQGIVPDIAILDDQFERKDDEATPSRIRIKGPAPAMEIKLSVVKKLLQESGVKLTEENDPTLLYADFILQRPGIANKKMAIEIAREIAAGMKY
jgi:carboxyl-terminal processing protease